MRRSKIQAPTEKIEEKCAFAVIQGEGFQGETGPLGIRTRRNRNSGPEHASLSRREDRRGSGWLPWVYMDGPEEKGAGRR